MSLGRQWEEDRVGYVTSNCMGRAVRQFEKEVSFKLRTGVECVTSNCMGRAVRQLIIIIIIIIPLFTLGSIYSTNVSGAEQMPETNNSKSNSTGHRRPKLIV